MARVTLKQDNGPSLDIANDFEIAVTADSLAEKLCKGLRLFQMEIVLKVIPEGRNR